MATIFGTVLRCVVLMGVLCAWSAAQDAVERWRKLPPEQQQELVRRFEALQALAPEEREAFVRRGRELVRVEQDVLDELSREQRQRLERLSPDARRRVLRDLVADRLRDRAERLRELLPEERLEALRQGDPRRRERLMDELRREHERALPQRLEHVARDLGLQQGELERLGALAPEEQRRSLAELVRRRAERQVAEHGLPPGIDAEEWERALAAPPEAFARRYGRWSERLGLGHPGGGPHGMGRGPAPRLGDRPGDRPGERRRDGGEPPPFGSRDLGPPHGGPPSGGPPPHGRPFGDRGGRGRALDATTHAWLGRLRAAGAPTPAERLELLELPPDERKRVLSARIEARVLGVLRELGVDETELAALGSLPPERFRHATRELVLSKLGGDARGR